MYDYYTVLNQQIFWINRTAYNQLETVELELTVMESASTLHNMLP